MGLIFLNMTTSSSDLLLNATALAFILDIDEIVIGAFDNWMGMNPLWFPREILDKQWAGIDKFVNEEVVQRKGQQSAIGSLAETFVIWPVVYCCVWIPLFPALVIVIFLFGWPQQHTYNATGWFS